MAHTFGTYENRIFLSGRLAGIYRVRKDEVRAVILVGRVRRGENRRFVFVRSEDGKIVNDMFTIRFFDGAAKAYEERFKAGDYVNVTAVAMTTRDRYACTNKTELWGVRMAPKASNGHMTPDLRQVTLVGNVSSVYFGTGRNGASYTSVTIYHNTDQETIRADGSHGTINYHGYLTAGVFGNEATETAKALQKGDWVVLTGRVREKKDPATKGKLDFLDIYHIEKLEPAPKNEVTAEEAADEAPLADIPKPESSAKESVMNE